MSKDKALKRLGYTEEWLSYGIISEEYLLAQYEEIQVSEVKDPILHLESDHYRCLAIVDFIRSREEITDDEIAAIIKLKDNGPDECDLHTNRIFELIHSGILNDTQLERIGKLTEVAERPLNKIYFRVKIKRKLNRSSVTDCFEEIKLSGDADLHKFILDRDDLKSEHVTWLSENGSNRAVRNRARQLSKSRKFRQ